MAAMLNVEPKGSQPIMTAEATASSPSWEEQLAARLRGFGPVGLLAIFFILLAHLYFVPLAALMVLVWTRLSRTPWRDIGYVRPKSWTRTLSIGLVFGVAFKLLMK